MPLGLGGVNLGEKRFSKEEKQSVVWSLCPVEAQWMFRDGPMPLQPNLNKERNNAQQAALASPHLLSTTGATLAWKEHNWQGLLCAATF